MDNVTGLVFEPFTEVEPLAISVASAEGTQSFGRMAYTAECEAAINEQINIEYNVSYVYHALYAYFNRDNVALPGLTQYFKASSVEEREHAEMLMDYQTLRGGKVQLANIVMPQMEFGGPDDKGDALYAMELALSLEKLNFQKLRALHAVADAAGDAQMTDFVEGSLLADQVQSVNDVAKYVAQLRRVGKGLGVYQFDQALADAAAA